MGLDTIEKRETIAFDLKFNYNGSIWFDLGKQDRSHEFIIILCNICHNIVTVYTCLAIIWRVDLEFRTHFIRFVVADNSRPYAT